MDNRDTQNSADDGAYDFVVYGGELLAIIKRDSAAVPSCTHCVFSKPKQCLASDAFDAGYLDQCDEDGVGFSAYYRKATQEELDRYEAEHGSIKTG